MLEMLPEWIQPLATVLFIDIVLAGDNAIVVGMAAAGLPPDQRKKAIFWGIIAATLMRIAFASITVQLLSIVGIVLAGGVLLLWVCWKMYRELREGHSSHDTTEQHEGAEALAGAATPGAPQKTLRQAITQILVADVSMSLDNVLAVAGAAKDHPYILIIGLAFSVVLMGVAATLIANLLNKHRWIAWVGLLVILYVAFDMIYQGTHEVTQAVPEAYAYLFLPLGFLMPSIAGVFPIWLWVGANLMQLVVYSSVVTIVAGVVRDATRRRAEA
jgi:YjbE family integral membrane protein